MVDFSDEDVPLLDILKYNWAHFDEHVSSLGDLNTFVFGFRCLDDLKLFVGEIIEQNVMPRTSARLKYTVLNGGKWGELRWVLTAPDVCDDGESLR